MTNQRYATAQECVRLMKKEIKTLNEMPKEEAYRKSLKNLIDARLVTKNGKAKKRICTR